MGGASPTVPVVRWGWSRSHGMEAGPRGVGRSLSGRGLACCHWSEQRWSLGGRGGAPLAVFVVGLGPGLAGQLGLARSRMEGTRLFLNLLDQNPV